MKASDVKYWLTLPFYLMLVPFALFALQGHPKQKIHKKSKTFHVPVV